MEEEGNLMAQQRSRVKEWLEKDMEQRKYLLLQKYEEARMKFPEAIGDAKLLHSLAENLMISEMQCPPDWHGWVTCKRCGAVPFTAGDGYEVEWCPWCHTVGKALEPEPLPPIKEATPLQEEVVIEASVTDDGIW